MCLKKYTLSIIVYNNLFIQAYDSILDGHETEVQTCALPISRDATIEAGQQYPPSAAGAPDRLHRRADRRGGLDVDVHGRLGEGVEHLLQGGDPFLAGQDHRRSEEHTSELQSRGHLVCRLLLEKIKTPADM